MNILDISIIVILLSATIYGIWHGFVRTAFSLFSTIIIIVVTISISPLIVKNIVEKTDFDEGISEQVISITDLDKLEDDILNKVNISYVLSKLNLPKNMSRGIEESYLGDYGDLIIKPGYAKYIADKIAYQGISHLVFIIVFLFLHTVASLILLQLDFLTKLPILKQANRLAGAALGVVLGIIMIWIICAGAGFVIFVESNMEIFAMIEKTIFFKLFFFNNPIYNFLAGLL